MKKFLKRFDCTLFDVASGPVVLAFFGIVVFIAVAVIALIIVAVILIRKALLKKKAEDAGKHDENT